MSCILYLIIKLTLYPLCVLWVEAALETRVSPFFIWICHWILLHTLSYQETHICLFSIFHDAQIDQRIQIVADWRLYQVLIWNYPLLIIIPWIKDLMMGCKQWFSNSISPSTFINWNSSLSSTKPPGCFFCCCWFLVFVCLFFTLNHHLDRKSKITT